VIRDPLPYPRPLRCQETGAAFIAGLSGSGTPIAGRLQISTKRQKRAKLTPVIASRYGRRGNRVDSCCGAHVSMWPIAEMAVARLGGRLLGWSCRHCGTKATGGKVRPGSPGRAIDRRSPQGLAVESPRIRLPFREGRLDLCRTIRLRTRPGELAKIDDVSFLALAATFKNRACSQSGTRLPLGGRSACSPCLRRRHLPPIHPMGDHKLSLQTRA
jgi:hypothetical protein